MPALQQRNGLKTAEQVVEFLSDLAQRLEQHHAWFQGRFRPLRFRAYSTLLPLPDAGKVIDPGPASFFRIDGLGRKMDRATRLNDPKNWYGGGQWQALASFVFRRVEESSPELKMVFCYIHCPDLLPPFFHGDVAAFRSAATQEQ